MLGITASLRTGRRLYDLHTFHPCPGPALHWKTVSPPVLTPVFESSPWPTRTEESQAKVHNEGSKQERETCREEGVAMGHPLSISYSILVWF